MPSTPFVYVLIFSFKFSLYGGEAWNCAESDTLGRLTKYSLIFMTNETREN